MILKAEDVKFTLYVRIQGAVKIKQNVGLNQPTLNVTAPMDILVTFVKQVCIKDWGLEKETKVYQRFLIEKKI